jgi:hypothetical protein
MAEISSGLVREFVNLNFVDRFDSGLNCFKKRSLVISNQFSKRHLAAKTFQYGENNSQIFKLKLFDSFQTIGSTELILQTGAFYDVSLLISQISAEEPAKSNYKAAFFFQKIR